MSCSCCGSEVQSGFAFCPKCGTKQPNACPGCGYACAPDFAYCRNAAPSSVRSPKPAGRRRCGRAAVTVPIRASSLSLTPSSTADAQQAFRLQSDKIDSEANRRTITVLFADLSGFTTMSERLDPEVMQTLQNELFEELTAAVQSFGGFVDKFIGDALLALFGAPAAHEDDPERAVRAALDMISRTMRLSERCESVCRFTAAAPCRHQHRTRRCGRIGRGRCQILFGDRRHGEYSATTSVDGGPRRRARRAAHLPS